MTGPVARLLEPVPAASGLAEPVLAIGRAVGGEPAVLGAVFAGGTRLTRRWVHGELHGDLPGLSTHLLVAHYGSGSAEAVWRTEGRRLESRMRAGTVTVIPVGQEGRWDTFGPIEVSQVYLPDDRLQSTAEALTAGNRVELLGRAAFADPVAARIMDLLSREDPVSDPSSRLFAEHAIDLLCLQLVRGHSTHAAIAAEQPRRGLAPWQVSKVTAYMRDHLDEEIGLDDLAAQLSLSRFHFGTAFRLATGRTPHDWLVSERIERARELLRDPRLAVTEIALSVGYQTPSSFAAAFRKVVGATPREFRRGL